jgi:hypothetical protein
MTEYVNPAAFDAALSHISTQVTHSHLLTALPSDPDDRAAVVAASIASFPTSFGAPQSVGAYGRRMQATFAPTTLTAELPAGIPLYLAMVSSGAVEYIQNVPAVADPAALGDQVNSAPFWITLE